MEKSGPSLERHVQSILLAGVIGILGWLAVSVESQGKEIVRLQAQMNGLKMQIAQNMDNRYRKSDAREDFALRDKEISELRERVRALEQKQ